MILGYPDSLMIFQSHQFIYDIYNIFRLYLIISWNIYTIFIIFQLLKNKFYYKNFIIYLLIFKIEYIYKKI